MSPETLELCKDKCLIFDRDQDNPNLNLALASYKANLSPAKACS